MRPLAAPCIVIAVAALTLSAHAQATPYGCTEGLLRQAPREVVEPCGTLLRDPGLSNAQRAQALFIRGRAYQRTKRLRPALEDYTAAIKLTPQNEEILLSRSNVHLRHRDGRSYADDVRAAFELNPQSARVMRSVGTLMFNSGQHDKALEFYNAALERDPGEPFALFFRAELHSDYRRFAEAIVDASTLVEVTRDPDKRETFVDRDGDLRDFHVVALTHRADILRHAGQLERARADYDAAVAADQTAYALLSRAEATGLLRGDPHLEIADTREAIRREPDNGRAHYLLGAALTSIKQYADAFNAFDTAVALRPHHALSLFMRARMHRAFGRTDEAVRDFTQAAQMNPGILRSAMPALRAAGYWTSPRDPQRVAELEDAIRACMLDTTCN